MTTHQVEQRGQARPVVDERVHRDRRLCPERDGRVLLGGLHHRPGVTLERRPLLTGEREPIGEGHRGVQARAHVDAALEIADSPGTDERARRELLLAQPRQAAVPPEQRPERRVPAHGCECT